MPPFYPPRLEGRWETVAMPAAWAVRGQYNQLHSEVPP